jgi:hypothetical protein
MTQTNAKFCQTCGNRKFPTFCNNSAEHLNRNINSFRVALSSELNNWIGTAPDLARRINVHCGHFGLTPDFALARCRST